MAKGLVRHFPTSDQTVGEAARFLYGMKPGDDYRILGKILSDELALSLVLPHQGGYLFLQARTRCDQIPPLRSQPHHRRSGQSPPW